ncbi:MAG: hypothetical protein U1F25_01970 [Rubrivivax sp.]
MSIGTNELIVPGELTYTKRLLVSVADSAGNAKADVPLSVSLDLRQFRKGFYVLAGDKWAAPAAATRPSAPMKTPTAMARWKQARTRTGMAGWTRAART